MISLSITNKIRRKQEHKFKDLRHGTASTVLKATNVMRVFQKKNFIQALFDGWKPSHYRSKIIYLSLLCFGSKEWRSDDSARCGPDSNPGVDALCGLSLLLFLSFAPRGFSPGTPVFHSPQKPAFPNSNSARNQVDDEPLCGSATSKSLFIYHFIFSNDIE